jgi:hypothetical protein
MAVRLTLKRSSIPNKRPNSDILDPGELALNTNALTPGLFFEADNNSVVKVGPTSVGLVPPTPFPSLGEMFFDEGDGTLKIGSIDPATASQVWKDIAAPYLGGTDGLVVFVAPEFPNASDAIENDGQAIPFKTINRAVIEVAKTSIAQLNESDAARNARYTIVVSPGVTPVYNGPGLPIAVDNNDSNVAEFNVNFEKDDADLPIPLVLQQFNPLTGGLPLPRGTSITGMDLRKTQLRPTYVPTYKDPVTNTGTTQPKSAILKWTGNSIVQLLSFRDKVAEITVTDFRTGLAGEGLFVSSRPHCLGFNDKVYFKYSAGTDQRTPSGGAAAVENFYYAYPVGVNEFYLSFTNMVTNGPNFIERSQLPTTPQNVGYLATCTWDIYSHNRLTSLYPATKEELDVFYHKIQLAFPKTFSGKANQAEVINPGETEIVAPVKTGVGESILSNTTENSSPYCYNVSLRSNYGLCGVEQDGALVTGFRSAILTQFTATSLQNDPGAYEIYTTVQDPINLKQLTGWYPLGYAAWAALPAAVRPAAPSLVPKAAQMELLNKTDIVNIRYYYADYKNAEGLSYGITDPETDFRHFSIKSSNNAYIQADSCWTIGVAVGYWAAAGGKMTITNSASNFTNVALYSDGFSGIGTPSIGTVDSADTGYLVKGIRMPQKLKPADATNVTVYSLGPNVLSVKNINNDLQEIVIGAGFTPASIQPYSLAPNTLVYSNDLTNLYSASFIDDGFPTVIVQDDGSCTLRVRRIDSSFPVGAITVNREMENWSPPFIRRWKDPRNIADSSYELILQNTTPNHRDPAVGAVLRLNQESQSANAVLRPGVQFDPAQSGGWGRLFRVAFSELGYIGDSPQLNEVLINRGTDSTYYVALSLGDSSRPWQETRNIAHGGYSTYEGRNWYAATNDMWDLVYFSDELKPVTQLKITPGQFNSAWAVAASSEILSSVKTSYQGQYAADPDVEDYEDGYYFRGDSPLTVNYPFELIYNEDNGSPTLGLLDYKVPTGVDTTSPDEITPLQTVIPVVSVEDFPNPSTTFSVVSLTDPAVPQRIEYCQLLALDPDTNVITVLRGYYGTEQDSDFPAGTVVTVQSPESFVNPAKYDREWSPTKSSMIRFLEVMGYSKNFILRLLSPRIESYRNQPIATLIEKPQDGYALATGAWPIAFANPSRINALSHSFHSAGRLLYSKGLPAFLKNEIPTKQYYDYLSSEVWGGSLLLTGADENGDLPTSGDFTQTGTGRPYDTFTSDITDFTRQDPGGAGGGGSGGAGVTAVFTGEGLSGGPIFNQGTIALLPPEDESIGGVKAGDNVFIEDDGTISVNAGKTVGTVSSIVFAGGLNGGTITTTGTVSVDTGIGLEINGTTGALDVKPPSSTVIGGIRPGTGLASTPTGVLNLQPPNNITGTIGGVKQGSGINIANDGTISVGVSFINILDSLTPRFDGNRTIFTLTVNGIPVAPLAPQYVMITVGGIVQAANIGYVTNNTTITFTSAPPAGTDFYGILFLAA